MLDAITIAQRYLDICEQEETANARFRELAALQGTDDAIITDEDGLEVLAQLAWCRGARELLAEVLDFGEPDPADATDSDATNATAPIREVETPPACVVPTLEAIPRHPGCYLLSGPATDAAGIHAPEWHALLTEQQLILLADAICEPLFALTMDMRARRTHTTRDEQRQQRHQQLHRWVQHPNGTKTYHVSPAMRRDEAN